LRFLVAALFSMLVVRSAPAQQPVAGTNMLRWLDYQEKLNQTHEEMELRSQGTFPAISGEAAVSVARLRHTPPAKALKAFQHGLKLDHAGETAGSAEAFRQAVALDPDYSEAHTDLGLEYINLGRIDDAVSEFREAIALDPATSVHYSNLALALIVLGRRGVAESEAQPRWSSIKPMPKHSISWVTCWRSARKRRRRARSTSSTQRANCRTLARNSPSSIARPAGMLRPAQSRRQSRSHSRGVLTPSASLLTGKVLAEQKA
jgi:tetratricopeptide (TPR) repeat protein